MIKKVQKGLGAAAYMECSALNGEGVQQVFEVAARLACRDQSAAKHKKPKQCIAL
jgi:hypothetical protein